MPDLIVLKDRKGKVVIDDDGEAILLMDLIEGSTYENAHVLEPDVIQGLESTYTGQMKDRFLLGEWAAYEGLVYPQYNDITHTVEHKSIIRLWDDLLERGILFRLLMAMTLVLLFLVVIFLGLLTVMAMLFLSMASTRRRWEYLNRPRRLN